MAKEKNESQIGSLTHDHGKSGIDLIPLRAGDFRHVVGKLSMRATTSVQTSSHLGVSGQKTIQMQLSQGGVEYTIWGKVVASPKFGP
jgi:hypothetical protein